MTTKPLWMLPLDELANHYARELRAARADALEQQTRAENAELALKMVRANVSVSELRKLLDRYDREGGFSGGALATCVGGLCAAAEQRAAAKPAEGGEP